MAPLLSLDTWTIRSHGEQRKPKAKCFLVGEGANTEFWYLQALVVRLAKEGKPELIEMRPVERTGGEKNQSSPRKLVEHARSIIGDADGVHGFDKQTDRVVIIFDADVYKGREEDYVADLAMFSEVAQVAVTYPSFEVFLLLHIDGGYEDILLPNSEAIVANGYVGGHRRCVEKLASDALGINVKKNPAVGKLADFFERAVEEEKKINQDSWTVVGTLTSNVGMVLAGIIEQGRDE